MSDTGDPTAGGQRPGKRYDAFISYSHAADDTFAAELQRGLQQFGRSWRQRRSIEVFRDETGLAVSPDLWESILRALDGSDWFLLLASPRAAQSRWVGQEIEHCVQTKGAERIIVVLTGGTLVWDAARGDFTDDSDAVHPALRGLLAREPVVVDMSWACERPDVSHDHERFRAGIAEVTSAVRGEPVDAVVRRDDRERRRTRHVVRGAVGALAALGVVAVSAGGVAVVNQQEAAAQRQTAEDAAAQAVEARDAAERQARIAQGRELAARAVATDPEEAPTRKTARASLVLAAEGHALAPGPDTAGALLSVLTGPALVTGLVSPPPVLPEGFSAEDVWSSSATGRVVLQRDGPGKAVELEGDTEWALPGAGFFLAPGGERAVSIDGTVVRLRDDGGVETEAALPAGGLVPSFSEDGNRVAYARPGPVAAVVVGDLATGQASTFELEGLGAGDCSQCEVTVSLSPDGNRVVARGADPVALSTSDTSRAWSLAVAELGKPLEQTGMRGVTGPGTVRFSDDGSEVWLRDGSLVRIVDPATLEPSGAPLSLDRGGRLSFVDDDRALVSADACDPPGLVVAPTMAVVGSLPADVQFTEVGCVPEEGYAAWFVGDRWILTAAGIWPAAEDDLTALACDTLGTVTRAELTEAAGQEREPVSCREGSGGDAGDARDPA